MARLGRGVTRRRLRSGYRSAGGAAPPAPYVGVLDEIALAGDSVAFALTSGVQLSGSWSGDMVRVRRASDSAEADIPHDPATHLIDTAALAAHCGANDGFIVTPYDWSGNARDFTNATTAQQPKIYDGATGIVLYGALPVAALTGNTGLVDGTYWGRGDSCGFSGTVAAAVFYFGSFSSVASYSRAAYNLGGSSAGSLSFRYGSVPSALCNSNAIGTEVNYRAFTELTGDLSEPSDYVTAIPGGGGQVQVSTLRQRGTQLTQSAVVNGPISFNTTASTVGAAINGNLGITGVFSTIIGLTAVPSAGALAALDAFGASLRSQAGV